MALLIALLSGVVFGLGLIAAGMTQPLKVKAFLDLAGSWDPSLALVMGGAIAVAFFAFARARQRTHSWTGARMELPTSQVIDARLVVGGVVFGAGWGLAGYCPGPGIVAASSGSASGLIFVGTMLVGMLVHDRLLQRR